jgi:uncharacterized protein (DUF697 family)
MRSVAAADLKGGWDLVKTVRTISPKAIEEEANAAFKLALVGAPEDRARLRDALLTDAATMVEREDAAAHLREFDEAPDADTAKAFAFIVYCPPAGASIGARGENSVPFVAETPEKLAAAILEMRPGLAVALARRFRLFRVPACNRIIADTSKINAFIALASALPGVLPITGIFLPAFAVADTLLLTKNQVMMIMRLAAAHGQHPAYTRQIKELIGTVGAGFGWRTVAREASGLVPAGVGVALKTSIAFSGTMAAGKAALFYYQTGRKPTKEQVQAAYEESREEGERVAEELQREVKEGGTVAPSVPAAEAPAAD